MLSLSARVALIALIVTIRLQADEFTNLVATFGTTRTLAGVHHATTTNPDGTAINFWTPDMEGGPATSAGLSSPHIAAADAYGNVYIAEKADHAILKITTDGLVHTFAGAHTAGFNGDGPDFATELLLDSPNGLYVLPNGVVYLLDPGNHRIRRVALNGQMTTIVNDGDPRWKSSGRALWVSQDEKLIYYTHEIAPTPPNTLAEGAVLKKWTPTNGIETVCDTSVGFVNPGNLDVNPADGKLYLTDRAEDDTTRLAQGLFRIDGLNQRTRITGDATQPLPFDGQPAIGSFIEQPRGIAFRPDGSYFICGHKDGSVWFVDTDGLLHRYLNGAGRKDSYTLPDGAHPPLIDQQYFAQPRAVTLAPDGNLIVVSNDSGFVFQVACIVPSFAANLHLKLTANGPQLEWNGLPGRGYLIESATALTPDGWDSVSAAGGTAGLTTFLDTSASTNDAQHFYRVLPAR